MKTFPITLSARAYRELLSFARARMIGLDEAAQELIGQGLRERNDIDARIRAARQTAAAGRPVYVDA